MEQIPSMMGMTDPIQQPVELGFWEGSHPALGFPSLHVLRGIHEELQAGRNASNPRIRHPNPTWASLGMPQILG